VSGASIFFSTFFLVFLAELGDKTQIASFSMAAESGKIASVIIGASIALISASLIAVLIGNRLALLVPKKVLKIISGLLFIGTGIFLLVKSLV
jgi:putative Ca2+/H+ antiporter (TMEM165/GDT1 family)